MFIKRNIAFKKAYKSQVSLEPFFGKNHGGSRKWWSNVISKTIDDLNLNASQRLRNQISNDLYNLFKTKEPFVLDQQAITLLKKLSSKPDSFILGVISNSDERTINILRDFDILDYFQFILLSFDIESEKPNKQIFEIAKKLCKEYKVTKCIHIGILIYLLCTALIQCR